MLNQQFSCTAFFKTQNICVSEILLNLHSKESYCLCGLMVKIFMTLTKCYQMLCFKFDNWVSKKGGLFDLIKDSFNVP